MSEISTELFAHRRIHASDAPPISLLKVAVDPSAPIHFKRDFSVTSPINDATLPDIHIQIESDLGLAASAWKAFETLADCTPFQTFAWLERWQRHIGARKGTIPAIVLGRSKSGEVLFILPLAIETGGRLRRLTWLGSELCDYNAPLLSSQFSKHLPAGGFDAVWKSALSLLRADARFQFDLVDLQKMPEMVGGQKNPCLALRNNPNQSGAYVATLGGKWEEYYAAKRSSATRKTARRKLRQLEEHGPVRLVEVLDPAESTRTLETLIDQKSGFFARMGVENMFRRPGYREFYLAIATDSEARQLVHVSRLDVGSTIAAANVGLQFRGCYYLTLSSYQDGELARHGPGRVHLQELLRHAIERGFRHFDFTIGDEPYKYDWADNKLVLHDHLAPVSARGFLVVSPILLWRRVKRFLKQTPIVWRAISRIRALTGRLAEPAADDRE